MIAQTSPDIRPIWLKTLGEEGRGRDIFDIKWLDASLLVFVKGKSVGARITMVLLATKSEGSKWWIQEDELENLKAGLDL